ncbi:hypothetical protein K503DRAFT_341714 [Rhizopogon vinicolor AM-OR11-026]|uniref:Uncharacterized protein n=1 Tax=Rhizopogon vinicolor AM-OR11-026 TaxID=1314800 RepID=A0A1B7NCD2_9AGAM|nr:hypothetical protein K503DRAFT_341714 [Rhizopogon vinicolor AM-OR11-026]
MSTMQTSTPRSSRHDLPPAPDYSTFNPTETGLAEWTSRIKAMQRQVDADDEAEQRRLEEEIVRARLARMRRSTSGMSGDFGIGRHGIDLDKLQESSPNPKATASSAEKPPPALHSQRPAASSATSTRTPISLAAFMGGSNAAGPRLKRQEPQQDATLAHDGRKDHGSMHPVFGRGGIAMPGMVKEGALPPTVGAAAIRGPAGLTPTPDLVRSRTTSTSSVARRYVEKLESQPQSQPQSLSPKPIGLGIRERRISTPAGSFSGELRVDAPRVSSFPQNYSVKAPTAPRSPLTESRPKTPISEEMRPKTPAAETRAKTPNPETVHTNTTKTPNHERTRAKTPIVDSIRSKSPGRVQTSSTRSNSSQLSWTPKQQPAAIPSATPTFPIHQTYSPQPHRGVSPAFLRTPVTSSTKDPTPSISRLQNRGFVQSVVQASGRLEAGAGAAKSTFGSPVQVTSEMRDKGVRRASVLDRWQPAMSNAGTPSPPPQSPKLFLPNRGRVTDAWQPAEVKKHDTGRSLKSAISLPAIPKTPSGKTNTLPENNNLGSSTTMLSYIKPTKTGDDPVVSNVDELGVKAEESEARTHVPSSPSKRLSHVRAFR